jgi:SPP1 gp7 family putative phage head morphogenesis protein
MPDPLVVRVIRDSQQRVQAAETVEMRLMTNAWLDVERSLESQMMALAFEIEQMRQNGQIVSKSKLGQMERYQTLLAQTKEKVNAYNRKADDLISEGQRIVAEEGIETAQDAIAASYREAGVIATEWNRLPIKAVEAMIGMTGAGTPLGKLLAEGYGAAADGMSKALIRAIAQGLNPRETARAMAEGLGAGLDRSLLIARTEQLRVYRESGRMAYQESGVVKRYRRLAAKQDNTCPACLFADGQIYELETSFEEHPNGRCTLVPVVDGLPAVNWQTGTEWFSAQDETTQQSILGAGWDLWKSGQIELGDFIRRDADDVWGASLRTATLEDLQQ